MIRETSILLMVTISIILGQNFNYQQGDWFILRNPGAINTIAETPYTILIGTEQGLYTQDKFTEEIKFDFESSRNLTSKNIYHIMYDPNTDYYWVVHKNGICYKSSISRFWRDLLFFTINHSRYTDIDDIGYTRDAVWIKSGLDLIALDPFNGSPIQTDIMPDENMILWGFSRYGNKGNNLDLYNYSYPRGWSVNYDIISDQNNNKVSPTVIYENKYGSTWIGTETGILLYGKSSSLKPHFLGLPQSHITEIYLDSQKTWWFADSRYKRSEFYSSLSSKFLQDAVPFLTQWDEEENLWNYYYSNESVSISSTDVNCINRIGNTVYIGTMNGLLILNLIDRSWEHLYRGLADKAVWDMAIYDNSLYIATARGINEISTISPTIIPDTDDWFKPVKGEEVYQLEIVDSVLFVASESGLNSVNLVTGEWENLSEKFIRKFKLNDGKKLGWDGQIWEITTDENEKRIYPRGLDFAFSGDFVWVLEKKQAVLYNSRTGGKWVYTQDDGIPGRNIYTIDCDENWVWFGTDEGVAYYNWSNYHQYEN